MAGKNVNTTHGMSKTRIYACWTNMKGRCLRKTRHDYARYGGRGVTVDARWMRFENFLEDMGPMPKGKQIDRIDGTKGYCKENCRWVTCKENCNNKANNMLVSYKGHTKTLTQWAEQLGLEIETLRRRLLSPKWTKEEAMETPARECKPIVIEYNGELLTTSDLGGMVGVSPGVIASRYKRGWTAERIVVTPLLRSCPPPDEFTHNGTTMTLVEWGVKVGMKPRTIKGRLRRGWTFGDAITKPLVVATDVGSF